MDIIQAIVLGLVQGITEFVPVSSSAHLIAIRWLLGWDDPGLSFDVALHLGTLVSVLAYFGRDWLRLIRAALALLVSLVGRKGRPASNNSVREAEGRLAWYILLATIPAALAGALAEESLENLFRGPTPAAQTLGIVIIGVVMIALALLLALAERVARHRDDMTELTLGKTLLIGLAQAFAIIPGISRSGSTITAGLFLGLKREAAARFSFLLGTPVIAGAGLKQIYDIVEAGGIPAAETALFAAGFATAAASGLVAIFGLLRYLQHNSTRPFIVYRVVVGLALIALALAGLRS